MTALLTYSQWFTAEPSVANGAQWILDDGLGSSTSFRARAGHFRYSLNSGHITAPHEVTRWLPALAWILFGAGKAVARAASWELVGEFTEVESGAQERAARAGEGVGRWGDSDKMTQIACIGPTTGNDRRASARREKS